MLKSRKIRAALAALVASILLHVASRLGFPLSEEQATQLAQYAVALALAYIGGTAAEDAAAKHRGTGNGGAA